MPVVRHLPASAGDTGVWVRSLGPEDSLETEIPTHSSILARRILWTKEPGGLQSMGLQSWMQLARVCVNTHTHTHTHIYIHTLWAIIKSFRTEFYYYLVAQEVKTQLLWISVLFFLKWIICIGRFLNTLPA